MNDQTYFLANAAHELQTLLSLLCSSIQAIEAAHPEVRCYRYWPELRRAYFSCLPLTEGTNKTLTYTSRVSCAYMPLDSPKMMEALLNLIVNALDAVSDNGSVQIILTKSNEQFVVSIIDDGCGIAPKQLLTIFHPFTTTKPDGTGLGLPVAKRIIEGHGGHIRVSSAPNQGATVTFLLPCSFSSDKK